MSTGIVVWKYQMKMLARNKFLTGGLIFLVIAGLYGARYGKHFVTEQNKVIYSVDTLQERNHEQILAMLQESDSIRLGQHGFFPGWEYFKSGVAGSKTVVYRPSDFATLSIGQKDNFPYYHEIVSGYEPADFYAITSTDVQNPVKLLAGNFDLAFVIIYLMPLVIIAMGYNALSAEKESNTFTLLRVQTSVSKVLRNKLAFQATLVLIISILMNCSAFWINGIIIFDNSVQMGSWIVVTASYILFWFSLVYLVASFRFPSSGSALLLGGLWVLLLLLLPSSVHTIVTSSHQKELVQSIFNRRGDFPEARELTPEQLNSTFSRLKHPYPLYAMNDTGQTANFFYDMLMSTEIQIRRNNAMGRKVVEAQRQEYERTLMLNWMNPVFAVQNAFNQVAGTEINNYHNYLTAAEKFQTKRRYFLYDYSLRKKDFGLADYQMLPEFDFSQPVVGIKESIQLLRPILVFALIFTLLAAFRKVEQP